MSLISLIIIFFISGKAQCNFEKITYLLSTYEITNSTDVIPRKLKSLEGTEKSLQVKAFGKVFILDLSLYFPKEDFGVDYISKLMNSTGTFLEDESENQLYYGYVRDVKNSYAIGFFAYDKYFKGYFFTDEVYCIEPYGDKGSLIVYRFKDIIVPGCSKMLDDQQLDCAETKYFVPWKANKPPNTQFRTSNYNLFYDKYFELYNRLQSAKTAKVRTRKWENGVKTAKRGYDTEFRHGLNKSNGERKKTLNDANYKYKQRRSIEEYSASQVYTKVFENNSNSGTFKYNTKRAIPENYPSPRLLNKEEHRSKDSNKYSLIMGASKEDLTELQCNVEVVAGPSLINRFSGNNNDMLKDIYTQFTLLDMILRKVTFSMGDKPFHLILNVKNLVVYADEVYNPFSSDLEYFTKTHRQTGKMCLTIGLVNRNLMSGQHFDGYIPEGGGGACAVSGNTILVSYGNEQAPSPAGLSFAALLRAVTRALGANDRDTECEVGTYPNPMKVVQDYFLNKTISISKEFSIFTECNVREIVNAVGKMKECFSKTSDPLCGNGIVDEGEECDCGPAYRCGTIDPCCNPPVRDAEGSQEKGCTLIEGAKCGVSQDCCSDCDVQKKKNIVCFSGSGACDIAMCDGESADCPAGVEASDGMVCSEYNETAFEPTLCKDSKCEVALCTGNGLQPCTCARGTARDCSYCCVKDGKCRTAGSELQLMKGRDFFRPNGADCTGGSCLYGKCVNRMKEVVNYTSPPMLAGKVNGGGSMTALNGLVVAALLRSLLVLLFLSSF